MYSSRQYLYAGTGVVYPAASDLLGAMWDFLSRYANSVDQGYELYPVFVIYLAECCCPHRCYRTVLCHRKAFVSRRLVRCSQLP